MNHWLAGRRVGLCMLIVGMGAGVTDCAKSASTSLADGYTSELEEQRARKDAPYREALRTAERLAKQVPTGSLRALYLRQMEADSTERRRVAREIVCEIMRQATRYAPTVAERAQKHLEDSLLAQDGMRDRWARVQGEGVEVLATAGCGLENVPRAPDSLERLPGPNSIR